MKRFLSLFVLLAAFCLNINAQSSADLVARTRIAKQGTTSAGDRGTFTVAGAETLNPRQFSFGTAWNNVDRTPKDLDINTFPVYFSYGVLSNLTVGAVVEMQRQVTARNLTQTGFYNALPYVSTGFESGLGDTTLSAKYRLQHKKDNIGGLALKGTIKFGSAKAADGLGSGRTDIGAEVLFTSLLPWNFLLHTNMGYVSTTNPTQPFDRQVRDHLVSGIGAAWPATGINLGRGELQGVFEYSTLTFVGCCSQANLATGKVQNPTDITTGVRYLLLDSGFTFDAGFRLNTKFDQTNPNNTDRRGIVAGISYTRPNSAVLTSNHSPLAAVESDVMEITTSGMANLTATGFDADGDRVSYVWTSTGGQVTANGERATFRAQGARPGKYIVRVLVSDGKGGTSSAEMEITVR